MHDIVQLVYVSRTVGVLDQFDVQQIIAPSRRNNWRAGVSGCLLFTGTGFAQALEGRPDAVQRLLDRITGDQRHTDIRIVLRAPISKRAFPNWSMGCVLDLQLCSDIDALLDMPDAPGLSQPAVARITDRMAADAFLGVS